MPRRFCGRMKSKDKTLNEGRCGKQKRGAKFGKFAASAAALLALVALTGCEQDNGDPFEDSAVGDKMQTIKIQRLKMDPSMIARKDVTTGKPVAITVQADNASALTGVVPGGRGAFHGEDYAYGHADSLGRPRGADSDYVDKADVYWKLNWLRKHLNDSSLPDDFEKAIKICREIMTTAKHDANYRLADDALTHLEMGLKHYRAAQFLRSSHVDTSLIPWSGGVEAAQRVIDRGVLGFGEKTQMAVRYSVPEDDDTPAWRRNAAPTAAPLLPAQQKIVDMILEYVRVYHATPDAARRADWKIAAQKTNRLRDELGLMNRPENREDNYDATGAGDPMLGGTDNVVPIPPDPNSKQSGMPGK